MSGVEEGGGEPSSGSTPDKKGSNTCSVMEPSWLVPAIFPTPSAGLRPDEINYIAPGGLGKSKITVDRNFLNILLILHLPGG